MVTALGIVGKGEGASIVATDVVGVAGGGAHGEGEPGGGADLNIGVKGQGEGEGLGQVIVAVCRGGEASEGGAGVVQQGGGVNHSGFIAGGILGLDVDVVSFVSTGLAIGVGGGIGSRGITIGDGVDQGAVSAGGFIASPVPGFTQAGSGVIAQSGEGGGDGVDIDGAQSRGEGGKAGAGIIACTIF